MFRLPRVFVENRAGVELPWGKIKDMNICWVELTNSTQNQMRTGDILLRIYSNPGELLLDTFYRGGELCPNVYFVLLLGELVQLPESFEIKQNLIYVGTKGCEAFVFRNWFEQISNDYRVKTYAKVMQTLVDSVPDMLWIKDNAEYHVMVNQTFCNVVGKRWEECWNKQHPEIWDIPREEYLSDDFVCRKTEREVLKAGKTLKFEETVSKDGKNIYLETYKTPLTDCYGVSIGTCGVGRNVTETRRNVRRLATVISAVPFPIFICDKDYKIMDMNVPASTLIGGYGTTFSSYQIWRDLFLRREQQSKHTNDMIYTYSEGASLRYFSAYEEKILDTVGEHIGYVCILIDVTYERICNDMLDKAAYYDYLTNAKNRRCFYEELGNHIGKEVDLIYFDLDHFKEINDLYGHDKGDEVLRKCHGVLKDVFGKDCVYRIGGDEFTVILTDTPKEVLQSKLVEVKDRIRSYALEKVALDISFGISHTRDLQDVEAFIRESDNMMYKAKGAR